MGERGAVLSILKLAKEIHDTFAGHVCPDWLEDVWRWRGKFQHDDQWFLQIIALKKLCPMVWDTEYRLFANMSCSDCRTYDSKGRWENKYVQIVNGEVLTNPDHHKPSILHFSGPQNVHRAGWAKMLGLL